MDTNQIKQRFLRDAAGHQLSIAHDDGVYRHLIFKQPGSSVYRFDLTTWPGYLAYTGDMGTYVFTRTHDMLSFFRRHSPDASIDYRYWAEKVEGADKHDGVRAFSFQTFKREVRQYVRQRISGMFDDVRDDDMARKRLAVAAARELRAAVETGVLECDDNEVRAYDAVSDFMFGNKHCHHAMDSWRTLYPDDYAFAFADFWETDCKEFTLRFVWCCHAMVWGIAQYDAALRAQEAAQAVPA